MRKIIFLSALCFAMALPLSAQSSSGNPPQNPDTVNATPTQNVGNNPDSSQDQNQPPEQFSYRVNVIQRSTQAVNYRDRGGTTQVDFKGTSLMPSVTGTGKVTGHTGRLAVDVSLHHLRPARNFGPEYLTYVLWAITSEGRPVNLGEVVPNGDGDVNLQLTSNLQEFGMIVTAEPYFAVTRPSDLVVAENIVRSDTEGGAHPITARYELLQRGQYTVHLNPAQLPATPVEHVKGRMLQILEAENAIAIAEASGAEKYAPDTLQKAKDYLSQAQEYQRRKQGKTPIGTVARAAVESAEDARLIAIDKQRKEFEAAQRQKQQERVQQAQTEAERQAGRAEEARNEAEREAQQRAAAEQGRIAAEQAQEDARRQAREAADAQAQAQQQLQQARQQQEQLAQQTQQAQLQAQRAEQARVQSEQQAELQRQRLLQQLNQVLQTKDTAKGLIVNVSDVLFDTGKATLKPGARVRLAKVSGIILAYPDLSLEVDGYTDSTGSNEFNQALSERRAEAVRDFLVSQGVSPNNVRSLGFGKADPIASNETAAGRQLNRRVEMVVSGTAIGRNASPGINGTPSVSAPASPGATSTYAPPPASITPVTPNQGVTTAPASTGGTATTPATPPQPAAGSPDVPTSTTTANPAGTGSMPPNPPPPPQNTGQQPPR
jgi:outer membrane protein OmpA-like peptidoglycan-associated protein